MGSFTSPPIFGGLALDSIALLAVQWFYGGCGVGAQFQELNSLNHVKRSCHPTLNNQPKSLIVFQYTNVQGISWHYQLTVWPIWQHSPLDCLIKQADPVNPVLRFCFSPFHTVWVDRLLYSHKCIFHQISLYWSPPSKDMLKLRTAVYRAWQGC